MRWRWVAANPIEQAEPPAAPKPNPRPPRAEEAARIVQAAWEDPDWGAFVWLAMTTGARRGELCALQWGDVDDLDKAVVCCGKASLKTRGAAGISRTRRLTSSAGSPLDAETAEILAEQRMRYEGRAAAVGTPVRGSKHVR